MINHGEESIYLSYNVNQYKYSGGSITTSKKFKYTRLNNYYIHYCKSSSVDLFQSVEI